MEWILIAATWLGIIGMLAFSIRADISKRRAFEKIGRAADKVFRDEGLHMQVVHTTQKEE